MSILFQVISVLAMALFSFVILTKTGVPVVFAILAAIVAGYIVWLLEKSEKEDEPRWQSALQSIWDLKDIVKYVHKIF